MAIADRQNAASLPAHLVLHAIELKGDATGEGLLSTLQDRRLTAWAFGARQLVTNEWPLMSIDRPAAHVNRKRLSTICLQQQSERMWERQLRVRFVAGHGARLQRHLSWEAPVIDTRHLMTCSSSL
ncbi:hypothetical protein ACC719_06525 [Rhizobium ruizarguesonis]